MTETARTRADVDIHQEPKAASSILDRFPTDCLVEILETQDGWYKIKPVYLKKTIQGFVPPAALIFPPLYEPQPPVFPVLPLEGSFSPVLSVPPSLLLADFLAWMAFGGRPGWLADEYWNLLTVDQQAQLTFDMLASYNADPARWDAWLADVDAGGRQNEAVMDEWIATLECGREVFAIRDHYVYKQPVTDANYHGCAVKGQIMHWTGKVRSKTENGTLRTFYEVNFYRMSREMCGWFRADITSRYNYPTADNDPRIPENAAKVFDLTTPVLRIPQDQEMADARAIGCTGAQYIDLINVLARRLRHYCLCGEFCAALLAERDIIPLLQDWYKGTYWRVKAILTNSHEGTCVGDLQNLLRIAGMEGEMYSSMPSTPQCILDRLHSGQFAITGCGITSGGKVTADGKIRHWVVLVDILPVGNGGWVRVYNPFHNREEVYPYDMFVTSMGIGAGLWVLKC